MVSSEEIKLLGFHDAIYLLDGERGRVPSCGPGTDTVYFDRGSTRSATNLLEETAREGLQGA